MSRVMLVGVLIATCIEDSCLKSCIGSITSTIPEFGSSNDGSSQLNMKKLSIKQCCTSYDEYNA